MASLMDLQIVALVISLEASRHSRFLCLQENTATMPSVRLYPTAVTKKVVKSPPHSAKQALSLWDRYRTRVTALRILNLRWLNRMTTRRWATRSMIQFTWSLKKSLVKSNQARSNQMIPRTKLLSTVILRTTLKKSSMRQKFQERPH